ncbi:hypothetical protein AAZX31_19G058700 [Glycine max]
MRKFTQKTELVRHGVTRFATTFLTLQRLHKQKANLKRMFTSDEWLKSKAAKETKGKQVIDVVLMSSLWNDVVYTLKAMGPLVSVLRLVDNEKKNLQWVSFMKQWIGPKRQFKELSITMKGSTRISLQSLIKDGIANFTTLCMQRVII